MTLADLRRAIIAAMVFTAFAAAALLLQWRLGASGREFISDESAHYITTVAIRDLVFGEHLRNPIRFLTDFYVHYQFLGIGLWPPVYHLLMAAWGEVFSLDHGSITTFVGCLVIALVATTVLAGRASLGPWLAVLAGIAVLLAPLTLAGLTQLLADLPMALFMLLAALAFGRVLESGRVRDGLLFGVTALAAIMTKGNALALCLLPPLAVLLTRRWSLFRRAAFWVPALVILPIAVPWYALTYSWASAGFRYTWGLDYSHVASLFIARLWATDFGPMLLLLAVLGAVQVLHRASVLPAVMLALLFSTAVFQSVVPAALEPRYLLPTVAPMMLLAASGAEVVADGLSAVTRRRSRIAAPVIFALGGVLMVLAAPQLPGPTDVGAKPLAAAVRHLLPSGDPVVLIASDAAGEGALSCELAMADALDPRIIVARGSRVLGGGGYNNFQYQPRFGTAAEALGSVEALRIPLLVLDRSEPARVWTHNLQLAAMLDRDDSNWVRAAQVTGGGRTYDLYVRRDPGVGPTRIEALAEILRPRKL